MTIPIGKTDARPSCKTSGVIADRDRGQPLLVQGDTAGAAIDAGRKGRGVDR